ncbi:sirohydrochlorin chelatase [Thermoflavimicrobium dichotomicum]|uniref:Sirohydrochlorin cobaltochelatase n=1 Tax=Thermoflavimicrobium dichotomicum TaxID=46223 RepID=A0A1I3PJW2_9BACL|nr:sirohydrochlorin chelatase [Thermoflavimicrobium dichotomicum]SFJ21964.1 sirohydrochlorin cobaltochelatase [Thermoflavimicrobium dichotomicum]
MEAILFVGHGSKDPEGNEELKQFTQRMAAQLDAEMVETCFLEFASPDIPEGIDICVARGAKKITLVPMMLFAAGHAKVHIPFAIYEAKEKYPDIEFTYKRAIEVDEVVLEIMKKRLREIQPQIHKDTAVLVVGRGSSDKYANSDLYKVARLFWEETDVRWVEVAFMGVTEPLFHEGMERCIRLGAKKIIVLPYFLFTGVLIKRMERFTKEFQEKYPHIQMAMSAYLGMDDELMPVFEQRLREENPGEGWTWEKLAEQALAQGLDHHHHHHHDHHHDHHHHH